MEGLRVRSILNKRLNWLESFCIRIIVSENAKDLKIGEGCMIIDVPDDIAEDFLNMLDVFQRAMITEDSIKDMSEGEQKCLKFVEKLLGDRACQRWKTDKERSDAARELGAILGIS